MSGGMGTTLSLELFTPRSDQGIDDLLSVNGCMAQYAALGPSLVSISGPLAAGTMRILEHVRRHHCIRVQLQISRPEATEEGVRSLLDEALGHGIRDVLILGSSVAHPQRAACEFGSTCQLLQFIKGQYADRVRVAVCGYPRGARGELGDHAADLVELGRQAQAGADQVICLPCFDAQAHSEYVAAARKAGVRCPIVPGALHISNVAEFRRICRALCVEPPAWLEAQLREATSKG